MLHHCLLVPYTPLVLSLFGLPAFLAHCFCANTVTKWLPQAVFLPLQDFEHAFHMIPLCLGTSYWRFGSGSLCIVAMLPRHDFCVWVGWFPCVWASFNSDLCGCSAVFVRLWYRLPCGFHDLGFAYILYTCALWGHSEPSFMLLAIMMWLHSWRMEHTQLLSNCFCHAGNTKDVGKIAMHKWNHAQLRRLTFCPVIQAHKAVPISLFLVCSRFFWGARTAVVWSRSL